MKAILYKATGETSGKIDLPEALFANEVNQELIHRLLLLQLANRRHSIAHTKTRWERRWSTRKIYRQKGTGNARMGSNRSPIRKKGWVAFGPRNNSNFTIRMNKKERRTALLSLLSDKAINNKVKVVEDFKWKDLKTKSMQALVDTAKLDFPLFVLTSEENIANKALKNVFHSRTVNAGYLNPHDILKFKDLVFTESSLKKVTEIFG